MNALMPYIPVAVVIVVWIGIADLGGRRLQKLEENVVAGGRHAVAVQVDWCKTDPVVVDIDASRNTALICGSTHNDWKCMFMFAIDPKNCLYVRFAS